LDRTQLLPEHQFTSFFVDSLLPEAHRELSFDYAMESFPMDIQSMGQGSYFTAGR
jgi:hypothetical protein